MRASAMPLAAKCFGSSNLNKSENDSGPRQNNSFGRMGTAFHELAYTKVINGNVIGFDMEALAIKYGLSAEDVDDIRRSLGRVNIQLPEGADVYAEKFIESNRLDLRGTPDVFTVSRETRHCVLIDWKSGWLDVEPPESNWQLISYAFIILEIFDFIDTVEVLIVQPRFNDVKVFLFTRALLESYEPSMRKIIEQSADPRAPLTVGPWCHSCFASMGCHAFAGQVIKISKMVLPEMVFGQDKNDIQTVLRETLPFAKAFARIVKQVEDLAKAYCDIHGTLDLGGGVEFVKTVEGKNEINMEIALPILRAKFPDSIEGSLKISNDAIKKLSMRTGERGFFPKIMQELEAHGAFQEKPITKYVIKKRGEEINGTKEIGQ